jgi:CubicO group peptidase (beta-lactamase class C family)
VEQLTAGGHQERAARLAGDVGATALVVSGPDGVIMSAGDPALPVHCRSILGTILELGVGRSMFEEFADVIAGPAGLQDFHLPAQRYATQAWSEHRTYAFHVSTRDLARFGEIYLRGGRAGHREIIPARWVARSTRAHAPTGRGPGDAGPVWGYLWWAELDGALSAGTVMPAGSFAAYGNGGQFLLVIPALQRVIALLADPARPGGTDAAPRRPLLARIVHHATAGAIPLGEPGRA